MDNSLSKVLIVEDDHDIRKLIRVVLSEVCQDVMEAAIGEEALSLINSQEFDLLVCDKNLPKMTGLELIRKSREIYPDLTVLMVTAFADEESREEARRLGVEHYISKPFSLKQFRETVQNLIPQINKNKKARPMADPERRVLIYEPSDSFRSLLVDVLVKMKYEVVPVFTTAKLIERVTRDEAKWLVCKMEIFEDQDVSTAQFLKKNIVLDKPLKVIGITNDSYSPLSVQLKKEGLTSVISRSLKEKQLEEILEKILNQ
jgi:two-component system response regulator (stage 0 sporulation protein F)